LERRRSSSQFTVIIGYFLFNNTLGSDTPADSVLLFALFWPKVIFMTGIAGAMIAIVIKDWHGNVNRMLLLRLLDAQQKADGKIDNAA